MLVSREECIARLRCPVTGVELSAEGNGLIARPGSGRPKLDYPIVNGVPIVVDFDRSVLEREATIARAGASAVERDPYDGRLGWLKRLISPEKPSTRRNVDALVAVLTQQNARPEVLVVGGGSIGQGMGPFYDDPDIRVFAFDIYASPNVQCVADGHSIPFADATFDAVIVQAVLEHVLDPAQVVAEIRRLLVDDGLVYAETPFMQQVHEAAYDFTRFSESGHRWLFRRFERIDSGSCGGPGTVFTWSVEYLIRSLTRSRTAGKIAKLAVFWAQYLDALVPESYAADGASAVYFLGRKSPDTLNPDGIIRHYRGAQ